MKTSLLRLLPFLVLSLASVACNGQSKPAAMPNNAKLAPLPKPDANGKITLSNAEWKKRLTENQYHILFEEGTEPPFHNAYFDNHKAGTYSCAACHLVLFNSDTKFESGTGWPSFYQPIAKGAVDEKTDADGMRTEVQCHRCGGHLGHVFNDGPAPTGLRYCMNSGALVFNAK